MTDHRIGHRWKVITGPTGRETRVYIDGNELHGIRAVKMAIDLREIVTLQVEVIAELLEIEGIATEGNPIILVRESAFAEGTK